MKVVHFGMGIIPIPPGDEAASGEEYIYLLTNHLGRQGCQVHVIDIKGGAYQKEKRQESSAEFHEVWHIPLPRRYNFPFWQHFLSNVLALSQVIPFTILKKEGVKA